MHYTSFVTISVPTFLLKWQEEETEPMMILMCILQYSHAMKFSR